MKKIIGSLAIVALALTFGVNVFAANVGDGSQGNPFQLKDHVSFCHESSHGNYNSPGASLKSMILDGGNGGHAQDANDIIPSFWYINDDEAVVFFAGLNINTVITGTITGQDVLDSGCVIPDEEAPVDACPNEATDPGFQEEGPCNSDDVCPNMAGIQTSSTQCPTTPPDDICPNIPGTQSTMPEGMMFNNSGDCVSVSLDECPNLPGFQGARPPGYVFDEQGNCVVSPTLCTDEAANNEGQPLPCTYNMCEYNEEILASDPLCVPPTPEMCQYNGEIPADDPLCVPPPPTLCTDEVANNVGQPLPCTYTMCEFNGVILATDPLCVPPVDTCTDEAANNFGQEGECTYNPPVETCNDDSANNFGEEGECTYDTPDDGDKPECSDGIDNDNDDKIDFPEDKGCSSPDDDKEKNSSTVGGRGGGGGGGGNDGEVLGEAIEVCNWTVDTYMRKGYRNNTSQVAVLQDFLNQYMKAGLAKDGQYGAKTEEAVKAFQEARKQNVLTPWKIERPTGIFYKTSLVEAKNLMCPKTLTPIPAVLINWSKNLLEVPAHL